MPAEDVAEIPRDVSKRILSLVRSTPSLASAETQANSLMLVGARVAAAGSRGHDVD